MQLRPSTAMQRNRAEAKEKNRLKLIELGWKEELFGRWTQAPRWPSYSYSFSDALALEQLRGNLGKGNNLAPKKGGRKKK